MLQRELGIEAAEKLPGGGILQCYWASIGGTERFLKTGAARYADNFAAEADGLAALRAAGTGAPEVLAHGKAAGKAYLLIEHMELAVEGNFDAMGRMLASLHRTPGPRYGWHRDNFVGPTLQENGWLEDWAQFWCERRIRPQAALALRNGFDIDLPRLEPLLAGHRPGPSLLHGDLWRGNAGFRDGAPVIFDPAVYYGDREADIAMTELFGGFPAEFYEAYNDTYPLPAEYQKRKHLYNLYHLLNHLNIFGGSYLAQVKATLGLLRAF